jgi:hypothetical protein
MARAYPFLISGLMILVGLVATSRLDSKLKVYVTGGKGKEFHSALSGDLSHLQPGFLRNVVVYWIDITQATALIIGPLLGVLIFIDLSKPWLVVAYAAATVIGIGLILWLALCADESSYSSRTGSIFTPVSIVGLVVDIGCGLLAYFLGK